MADQQYDNELRGALFKNDKQGNEKRPDYRGEITIGGVTYWLSAWLETSRSGVKYMSLKAEAKDGQQSRSSQGGAAPAPVADDDIPF